MIARIAFVGTLVILTLSPAHACKPLPWAYGIGVKSVAEYARGLLSHSTAILFAEVASARRIDDAYGARSTADILVLERFKGPDDIRQVHSAGAGTCVARTYSPGEKTMFVLLALSAGGPLHDVLRAGSRFPTDEVLTELRKLTQPNSASQ